MHKTKYIPLVTTKEILKTGRRYINPNLSLRDIDINTPRHLDIYPSSRGISNYPDYLNTSEALLKKNDEYGGYSNYTVLPTIIKWDDELESHKPLDEPVFKQNHVNVYPLNIGNQEQIKKKKGVKYYKDSLGNYVIKRNNQQNIPYDINTYNIPIKKKQ